MANYPMLKLKQGREANLGFKHPWVFSGAIETIPVGVEHGAIVRVADQHDRVLGTGTFSRSSMIAVRMFEFGDVELSGEWFVKKILEADERRALLGFGATGPTTGYRVVFGEADQLPGIVVDRYGKVCVLQISTAGADQLRGVILDAIVRALKPSTIVERSDIPSRREDQLKDVAGVVYGKQPSGGLAKFKESGYPFVADVLHGQKTGFFLDQKELRAEIFQLAKKRSVLNLFSYSGASGVYAMKGKATSVHNVDESKEALELCAMHAKLNRIPEKKFTREAADVFAWVASKKEPMYDMILVDPPALIKSKRDREAGCKAYHFLNRAAMRLVKPKGIFVTSSCSRHLSEDDFMFLLRRASVQAGIRLSVLKTVGQSADHPLSLYFPESRYLKSFICQIN